MPNLVYQVDVTKPCTGEQLVNKLAPTHYAGSNGDFTHVVMTRSPADPQWKITVYDYSRGITDCTPSKLFQQITPDADDPTGNYEGVGFVGDAEVSNFP